jgi:hypothetical protein
MHNPIIVYGVKKMEVSTMYRLDKIQQMLSDRQVQAIADATGLSRWTIYNVRKGVGKIRYETVERLSDYFERQK